MSVKLGTKVPATILMALAVVTCCAPAAVSATEEMREVPSEKTIISKSLSTFAISEIKVGKKVFTASKIIIKATPACVWAVLTDYNGAASIFSNLSKSKLVSSSGPVKLVAFTTKANVLKFDYTLEVTEKDQELIEWKRSSGAFQANDGYWKLEPLDNGRATLVSYAKHVDGGFFYPQPLVKKLVRESIPAIFSDLKAAAESPQVAEQVRALKFPL